MMGERMVAEEALFYSFNLERHVPTDHLLRRVDRFVDLSEIREHLRPFYSETGRPSIDPELMIRMLIIGYCMGIRSERRLCDEVHLNLAYRWFCRLGLEGDVPDHSTFSKNRHGRFRDSDLLRNRPEPPQNGQAAPQQADHHARVSGINVARTAQTICQGASSDGFFNTIMLEPAIRLRKMAARYYALSVTDVSWAAPRS